MQSPMNPCSDQSCFAQSLVDLPLLQGKAFQSLRNLRDIRALQRSSSFHVKPYHFSPSDPLSIMHMARNKTAFPDCRMRSLIAYAEHHRSFLASDKET